MSTFFRKLRWLIQRPDKETELREELQFHLDEEAEQRQEDGSPKDMPGGERAVISAISYSSRRTHAPHGFGCHSNNSCAMPVTACVNSAAIQCSATRAGRVKWLSFVAFSRRAFDRRKDISAEMVCCTTRRSSKRTRVFLVSGLHDIELKD